jgi:hypothetical protein
MNEQQLKTGKAILFLIQKTEEALNTLNRWIDTARPSVGGEEYEKDNHYNLFIGAYKDGSGTRLNLERLMGNTALLELIQAELERQLAKFKQDFANL